MKLADFYTAQKLPVLVATIQKNLSVQKKFLNANTGQVLLEARQNNDGTLEKDDFEKIKKYYGLAVPAILGEAFCVLHKKKMSPGERMASTCQGAMTGLFDDFFDKESMSEKSIQKIMSGDNIHAKKSNENLFDWFYKRALEHAPDKHIMQSALQAVYQAQVESKKQTGAISEKEILDITSEKGGTSLLFYRSAFLPHPEPEEESLLYNLGAIMQLANDIFDVYKDRMHRIKTLATETSDIQSLQNLFREKLELAFEAARHTNFSKKNKTAFLSILSLGIFSRAFVCLEQLKTNASGTGNRFMVHQYTRAQLICDMDTKSNMLRSAFYHLKIMRSA